MEMALKAGDPAAAQLVAAECVVDAETKDHQNWELHRRGRREARRATSGALREAYEEVEDEEDEHLYHTMGWTRELWIESLGMPAVLPPPEEKKDVKTAIGAARAKQAREHGKKSPGKKQAAKKKAGTRRPERRSRRAMAKTRLPQPFHPQRSADQETRPYACQRQERRPRAVRRRRDGRDAHHESGHAHQRQPEHAEGRRARPVAARGLPLPREDHALRPRAHPRAHRARARARPPTATSRSTRASRATRRPASSRTRRVRTPVFVRFSTVAGSRGSTDLARDVRGFAVKFYTEEGIFDLVGNNIPVFFIQDAIKFPDLVHAVKPEPRQRDAAGRVGARHVLGLHLADARVDAHDHVGDVRPRDSAQLPHDGRLRRPHVPLRQRRRASRAS